MKITMKQYFSAGAFLSLLGSGAAYAAPTLYYSEFAGATSANSLYTSNASSPVAAGTSSPATVVLSPVPKNGTVSQPLDVEASNSLLYYTDASTHNIYSVNPSAATPAATSIYAQAGVGIIYSLAANSAGTTLYFTDTTGTGTINSISTSGPSTQTPNAVFQLSNLAALNGQSNESVRGLALDSSTNTLYFADGTRDGIYSVKTDGSASTLLLNIRSNNGNVNASPTGVAVGGGKLYFNDNAGSAGSIYSADLDGSHVTKIFDKATTPSISAYTIQDLQYFEGNLYFTDSSAKVLDRLSLSDNSVTTVSSGYAFRGVAVVPEPASLAALGCISLGFLSRRRR